MAGNLEQAQALLLGESKPMFIEWLAAINVLIDLQESMNQEQATAARGIGDQFFFVMLVLCGAAVLAAAVLAWRITRSITRPMADAVAVFTAVAEGDLTQRLNSASKDGLGEMGRYANKALARVRQALGRRGTQRPGSVGDQRPCQRRL